MKIHIQKLGILENTDFELRKGLTLLVGQNQTGKSYVSYLVNAIFDRRFTLGLSTYPEAHLPIFREWTDTILNHGVMIIPEKDLIDIIKQFYDIQNNRINWHSESERTFFQSNYKLNYENVNNWSIYIKYNIFEKKSLHNFSQILEAGVMSNATIGVNKNKDGQLELRDFFFERRFGKNIGDIDQLYHKNILNVFVDIFNYALPYLHFEIAERAGYIPHLSFLSNALIDDRERASLMPHVVHYVQNQNRLSDNMRQGDYHQIADKYSLQIMKGRVLQMQNAPLIFEFGAVESGALKDAKQLYVHAAASTVKSLAGLFMFLRSEAREGDVILIDEPEIHLHPDNQIWVARMLAELVNAGLNIIVSTHSVIILQELNNLVRLGSAENLTEEQIEQQADIQREFGYTPEMCLTPDQLHPYLFRFRDESKRDSAEIVPLNVNWEGIDQVQSISKSLYQLNKSVYRIYDELVRPRSAQEDDED